ncbi:YibE/F family protein [Vibrio sp. TH_r3]|uniref:YibE/F family protein n=1 Tax=Vibrio sp. TH_r3 TaxID=3082084 RepID=UPI002955BC87|nr:YibE/F family protein [Vibrio sp. TH_r3]MDV7105160.1 YibE/F family protein [Vibrio sp. TH_r3]
MRAINLLFATLLAVLLYDFAFIPSDNESVTHYIGDVTSVNNERVTIIGTGKLGDQKLTVEVNGEPKEMFNLLTGALEYDEFYYKGDRIVVAEQNGRFHAVALFRLPVLIGLLVLFAIGLLAYARKVGFYSLLSFVGSVGIIFGIMIPGLLAGISPILITSVTVFVLSSMIILSVAGWTTKGQAALMGTTVGLFVTTLLCVIVGKLLHLDGMTQPLAQPLLFENSMKLDMVGILYAAILVGASGAAMDVAMEMAATMEEIKLNSPDISRNSLLKSGLRVGNAVIGTMTTTLLLAYAGGFLTLLMLFATRGNSLMQILNMKLVASEVCRTLIGSLALIIVAPVTAWIASYMLEKKIVLTMRKRQEKGSAKNLIHDKHL